MDATMSPMKRVTMERMALSDLTYETVRQALADRVADEGFGLFRTDQAGR
jgi:hypothetical protein